MPVGGQVTDRLERLWAGWRAQYVSDLGDERPADRCVLCGVLDQRHEHPTSLVHVGALAAVVLNKYPYTTGHVMVLPYDHHARLADLSKDARTEVLDLVAKTVEVIEMVYRPDGVNFGANLGRGAGAGIPDHLHVHVLPRWDGDTNFMTTVAGLRVIPEDPDTTLDKLRAGFGHR